MVSSVSISDNDGGDTIVEARVSLRCTVMIVPLIPYSPKYL